MSELKPCPFCGGEAALIRVASDIPFRRAACLQCGTEMRAQTDAAIAIAAWNRRPDAPSAGDWESIETAPKDGTRVLMWGSGWDAPTAWEWVSEAAAEQELSNWTDPPTHWMPLPAPPQADGAQG